MSNAILGRASKSQRSSLVRFCIEAISIPAVAIIHRLFYNVSGFLLDRQSRNFDQLLETGLDLQIPYTPIFIIPYMLTWVMGVMVFVYVVAYKTYDIVVFRALYLAVLASTLLEFIIWQILPASISIRVPMDVLTNYGFLGALTAYVYQNATVWNVFPSAHISHAAIAWIFSRHFSLPRHRIIFIAVFILICLSVILVRNHFLLDIPAGILITLATYRFVFLPVIRNDTIARISSVSWLMMLYGLCVMVMLATYIIMGNAWTL